MQLKLKNGVGASRDSNPKDVIKAKTVLNVLGELKPDPELGLNGFVDHPFDTVVRRFQKRRGLLVTGEIKPGDETEDAINAELGRMERQPRRAGSAGRALLSSAARAEGTKKEMGQRPKVDDRGRGALQPSKDVKGSGFIGPGGENTGEDAGAEQSRDRTRPNSFPQAGRPTVRPVDAQAMFKALCFDPSKPGENEEALLRDPSIVIEAGKLFLKALQKAPDLLPNSRGAEDNDVDAVRHALWSYWMTKRFGADVAKRFGDAHEISEQNRDGVRLMDLFNNNMGRRLTLVPRNARRSAEEVILEAVRNGQLQTSPFKIKKTK